MINKDWQEVQHRLHPDRNRPKVRLPDSKLVIRLLDSKLVISKLKVSL